MDDLLFLTDTIDSIESNTAYELLPVGTYTVTVIGSETKVTRAGNGKYLALTLEVVGGPHNGRRLWDNINVANPNPTAQEIGQKALKTLKDLCGIQRMTSSTQFLGHQIPIKVEIEPRKDKPDTLQNVVRYSVKAGGAQASPRPASPAAAAEASAPAWRNRATAAA